MATVDELDEEEDDSGTRNAAIVAAVVSVVVVGAAAAVYLQCRSKLCKTGEKRQAVVAKPSHAKQSVAAVATVESLPSPHKVVSV